MQGVIVLLVVYYLLGSRSREIYDTVPLAQSLFAISLIVVISWLSFDSKMLGETG